jgi:hypothetical protein
VELVEQLGLPNNSNFLPSKDANVQLTRKVPVLGEARAVPVGQNNNLTVNATRSLSDLVPEPGVQTGW